MKKDRKTVREADIKKAHSVKKTGIRFQNLYQQIISAELLPEKPRFQQ